uniref:Zinc finger protein n=1 Tax=Mesocestoides corti TaxID=53468 RepID=A0A5K3FVH9_MESCO
MHPVPLKSWMGSGADYAPDLHTVPLYVANPLMNSGVADPFPEAYLEGFANQLSNYLNSSVPLTPIPEVSEFSLRSSVASTAPFGGSSGGAIGSSNGSLPLSVGARRLRDTSPNAPIVPPVTYSLRSSLESSPRELFTSPHKVEGYGDEDGGLLIDRQAKGGPTGPSSVGSSSLNEFLRLEEQESLSEDLEKQMMEGQEGDMSLVESVVGGMRNVEEGETSSISRSLGPSSILVTDSVSILSSSFDLGPSFASLPHPGSGSLDTQHH